jgi:protein-disulfide isomerase
MQKIISYIFILTFIFTTYLHAEESKILKIGNEKANITVKVFSSLTCPHCAKFHLNIFAKLKTQYIDADQVLFEHHSFPLDLAALNAEKMLRSVRNKEKSFQLLSKIYENQNQWAVGSDIVKINKSLKKIGLEFGLKNKIIENYLKDENIQDQILNERIKAQKNYKIESTPTIYINKKKYEGDHNFKSFKKAIDKLL